MIKMSAPVVSILNHSRDAVRRAGGRVYASDTWRDGYKTLSQIGVSSLGALRGAGDHRGRWAAVVGGSAALAAGTVYVARHSGRVYADVLEDEQPYRISTLDDLREDEAALELIQRELLAEWGPFAPRDMEDMRRLARNAGRMVFVIRFYEDGRLGPPSGVLQTALAGAGGDPVLLKAIYPSFDAISAGGTWEASPSMRGDTALLLQITAFGERSRGVGSRLRDAALYMLPETVKYALTTTPVPEGFSLESDPESSPATRFHYRGGARPAGYAPGFKVASAGRADSPAGRQSNQHVVFMRYRRLEDGDWDGVKRPALRLRRSGVDLDLPELIRGLRPPLPLRRQAQPAEPALAA